MINRKFNNFIKGYTKLVMLFTSPIIIIYFPIILYYSYRLQEKKISYIVKAISSMPFYHFLIINSMVWLSYLAIIIYIHYKLKKIGIKTYKFFISLCVLIIFIIIEYVILTFAVAYYGVSIFEALTVFMIFSNLPLYYVYQNVFFIFQSSKDINY